MENKIIKRFDREFPYPDSRGIFYGGDPNGIRRKAIKKFILTELKALKEELKYFNQNILLRVQQGEISTGRAIELQRQEIIKAFAKRGV
jgi:hypothetical protein